MAGSPKKRQRRDQAVELAAGAGMLPPLEPALPPAPNGPRPATPAASVIADARSSNAPARAHARAREHAGAARTPPQSTTRAPVLGTQTRGVLDDRAARGVASLASTFKPGYRLRLTRLLPTWARGYLEDYPIAQGETLASFYEHVALEHGGLAYRIEVLAAGDVVMFEGTLDVAGPPKERGKLASRARFEGREEEEQPAPRARASTTQVVPASPAFTLEGIVSVATLVLGALDKRENKQMQSVEKMVEHSRDLVVAALGQRDQREKQTERPTFAQQLGEIVDATTALDRVKKVIGGTTPRTRNAAPDDDDDTKAMVVAAKKVFFESVAQRLVHTPQAAAAAAPAPARPQQRAAQPRGFIPDARSPRQAIAKN